MICTKNHNLIKNPYRTKLSENHFYTLATFSTCCFHCIENIESCRRAVISGPRDCFRLFYMHVYSILLTHFWLWLFIGSNYFLSVQHKYFWKNSKFAKNDVYSGKFDTKTIESVMKEYNFTAPPPSAKNYPPSPL